MFRLTDFMVGKARQELSASRHSQYVKLSYMPRGYNPLIRFVSAKEFSGARRMVIVRTKQMNGGIEFRYD